MGSVWGLSLTSRKGPGDGQGDIRGWESCPQWLPSGRIWLCLLQAQHHISHPTVPLPAGCRSIPLPSFQHPAARKGMFHSCGDAQFRMRMLQHLLVRAIKPLSGLWGERESKKPGAGRGKEPWGKCCSSAGCCRCCGLGQEVTCYLTGRHEGFPEGK